MILLRCSGQQLAARRSTRAASLWRVSRRASRRRLSGSCLTSRRSSLWTPCTASATRCRTQWRRRSCSGWPAASASDERSASRWPRPASRCSSRRRSAASRSTCCTTTTWRSYSPAPSHPLAVYSSSSSDHLATRSKEGPPHRSLYKLLQWRIDPLRYRMWSRNRRPRDTNHLPNKRNISFNGLDDSHIFLNSIFDGDSYVCCPLRLLLLDYFIQ